MSVRPITDTLRHLEGGTFIDEASDKLSELVKAVEATGKPGSITMTIKVRRATAGALAVIGDVKAKVPAEPKTEALLFATPEGNLMAQDPRQNNLDLKPVAVEAARELKQIAQ